MKKPIIGISGNEYRTGDHTEPVLSYTQTCLVEAVEKSGGIPLILPVTSPNLAEKYASLIDKLILTGGQHVQPHLYGESKQIVSANYHQQRDLFDIALIKACHNKPILGICRGLQLYNVAYGGSLHQAIPKHWQDFDATIAQQAIRVASDSTLSFIYGKVATVNSFHRQAIKKLADQLTVTAICPSDGTIEAIEDTDKHFLGVQWHPELLFDTRDEEKKLFNFFIHEY